MGVLESIQQYLEALKEQISDLADRISNLEVQVEELAKPPPAEEEDNTLERIENLENILDQLQTVLHGWVKET